MFFLLYLQDLQKDRVFDYLDRAAQRAVVLKAEAYVSFFGKIDPQVWYFGPDGGVVGKARIDSAIDDIKVSPDGSLAVAVLRQWSSSGKPSTVQMVVSSRSRRITTLERSGYWGVQWCGRDLLLNDCNSLEKWAADSRTGQWTTEKLGNADGSVYAEGRRYWKIENGNLIEMVADIPVNSVKVADSSPYLWAKIDDSPFVLHASVSSIEGESLRAKMVMSDLRTGRESLVSNEMFALSAVVLKNPDRLLYFRWTKPTMGQLTEKILPDGPERALGEEARVPVAVKLDNDHVLVSDQGDAKQPFDRLFVFEPKDGKFTPIQLPGPNLLVGIGSCRRL